MIDATWWRWARPLVGALVLAALVVGLGTGPFLDALRATDARALMAGAFIALLTTLCGAWRWRLVARRLGADLTLAGALASCYRAQFLNVTLPGGVLPDPGALGRPRRALQAARRRVRISRSAPNCPDNYFYGTYNFDVESELRRQGHRPLRSPAV